ncbi:MAG: photosynthetic reaction center cytochrome c subunit [Alphaproteobacteria bacterium]|nr:photosynthetic reaction center cytochrome c subunit [Alphaproteobacteria bacterium]
MNREPYLLPVTIVAVIGFAALAGWFLKVPSDKTQVGYRGIGMEVNTNRKTSAALAALNAVPEPQPPLEAAEMEGPRASEVYKNVKVLGHLSEAQFNRVMAAITEWVSPEQGCAYCHGEDGNFESDAPYAKVISRRMFEMTQYINGDWQKHVGQTGVTCYTCHRGKNVPENIWFDNPERNAGRMVGNANGQNKAGVKLAAFSSLPVDPLSKFAGGKEHPIRVQDQVAITKDFDKTIQDAEWTYSLMMHMSQSLGVNCTACHNTSTFGNWQQSTPQRVSAWHGIRMVGDLNAKFLDPLKDAYPAARLGPTGDAPKANCATCHQGVQKPLYGANMLKDYLASLTPPAK